MARGRRRLMLVGVSALLALLAGSANGARMTAGCKVVNSLVKAMRATDCDLIPSCDSAGISPGGDDGDDGGDGGDGGDGDDGKPIVPGGQSEIDDPNAPVVGSYYPNWFVYKKIYMGLAKVDNASGTGTPSVQYAYFPYDIKQQIKSTMTHLFYAFLDVGSDCSVVDRDPDASWYGALDPPAWIELRPGACKGAMNDFHALKTEYPHLNLMMSLGGWTYSDNFSKCSKSEAGRKKIYTTTNKFLGSMDPKWGQKDGLWAGIDFDWEFPGAKGNDQPFHEADWLNYVKLINEFRAHAKADGRSPVLSAAVGMGETVESMDKLGKKKGVEVGKLVCDALDFFNLMAYDLHGKWAKQTGHNANFCVVHDDRGIDVQPKKEWTVQSRVAYYNKLGCAYEKMALGIPNYGPAWAGIPAGPQGDGLYQTTKYPGNVINDKYGTTDFIKWSTFSEDDAAFIPQGQIHYWDAKASIGPGGFTEHTYMCPEDEGVKVPVSWLYSKSKELFNTYESAAVAEAKGEWAAAKKMRGFFFWDISQDKEGELMLAAAKGWNKRAEHKVVTHKASGSFTCNRAPKPSFVDDSFDMNNPKCDGAKEQSQTGLPGCADAYKAMKAQCGGSEPQYTGSMQNGACVAACIPVAGGGMTNGKSVQAEDVHRFNC